MRIERSKEWWLSRIAGEADVPIGASGSGLAEAEDDSKSADRKRTLSFSELVHLLRRRQGLSIHEFAELVDIELSDAQLIEEDPFYCVDARTVWAIATAFKLPQGKLNEMAGIVVANDRTRFPDLQRYAARSELRKELSHAETKILDVVVSVIGEQA